MEKNQIMFIYIGFIIMLFFLPACRGGTKSELELLLSIKASMNDPLRSLENWENNTILSYCQWTGIACDNSSSHVVKIELSGKNLSGKFPRNFFLLQSLESLDLSNNELVGEIPGNLSLCSSLKSLNLSTNNLTGNPPRNPIFSLQVMDLSNNMLSGEIPEEIGLFSGLKILDFGGNDLVGEIPKCIWNLTMLESLGLSSNHFVGEIPGELGFLKRLKFLYLGYNNLSGLIPEQISELPFLFHLNLAMNNHTGKIPSTIGNLKNIQYLYLYGNKLTGEIPQSIFNLKNLISLDLSDNFLSGEIPENVGQLKNLEVLHLFRNLFTGKIPESLTSLPNLQVLQLWSNNLTGQIPGSLGKFNNLSVLDLSTNNLAGKIPENLCSTGYLSKLILFSNSLEGPIPERLGKCRRLQRVRLQNNKLSGELPEGFIRLSQVYFLDLSGNNLTGTISGKKYSWDMPQLQMLNLGRNRIYGEFPVSFGSVKIENLDLSGNRFSGNIPKSFGTLSELVELNLSKNRLSGEISQELSSCKKMVLLDLSQNHLSGKIPESLSDMPVLSQLDLSMNQLSGEIPENLGKVQSLVEVNVSHNHLRGQVPSTGAFLAINSSAVTGNNLCRGGGGDKSADLPPCRDIRRIHVWWGPIVICLVVILVVVGLAGFITVSRRRKKLEMNKESDDGTWELQMFDKKMSQFVTIEDVLSSINDDNIMSRGKNGVSYKGYSTKIQFFLQVFSGISSLGDKHWSEIASEYGNICHPNVVKIVGFCMSQKACILVHEFIEGRIMSDALGSLCWAGRRKVAIGVAKALRYLHGQCIFGGEVSPRKIIVDKIGVAHLLLSPTAGQVRMEKRGYISSAYSAPETIVYDEWITEKSDVYGYGLILIQLLTGKDPNDEEFGVHESFVEWARHCYSECLVDAWIDPLIIKGEAKLKNGFQNETVELMNISLQCTASDPAARPCSNDVIKMLERSAKLSSCGFT